MSIILSLLFAWVLAFFGFDELIINGAYELFKLEITKTGYYFIFAMVGIIAWIGALIKGE